MKMPFLFLSLCLIGSLTAKAQVYDLFVNGNEWTYKELLKMVK